jgi:hypothetical protein
MPTPPTQSETLEVGGSSPLGYPRSGCYFYVPSGRGGATFLLPAPVARCCPLDRIGRLDQLPDSERHPIRAGPHARRCLSRSRLAPRGAGFVRVSPEWGRRASCPTPGMRSPTSFLPSRLTPHEHHRAIRQRQVTDHPSPPTMPDRPQTTRRAPALVLGGLRREPPLAARLVDQLGAHGERVQSEQRGHAATVAFHQGLPVDVAVGQPHQ